MRGFLESGGIYRACIPSDGSLNDFRIFNTEGKRKMWDESEAVEGHSWRRKMLAAVSRKGTF